MSEKEISNWKYEDIKKYINDHNYVLLSNEYVKDKKLLVRCDKDHEYEVAWYKFYIGQRCKICRNENKKLKYEDVKQYIHDQNYVLLSNEYINNSEKLDIACDKGHVYKASFNKFKGGRRCPICAKEKRSESQRRSFKEIEEFISNLGYELLSNKDDYKNQCSKLTLKCNHGHVFTKSYNKLLSGQPCTICSKLNQNKKSAFSFDFVKLQIENNNYKLISNEYKNMKTKLEIECNNGHVYNATFEKFMSGQRCPKCNMTDGEFKINKYLTDNGFTFSYQYKFEDCKIKKHLPFDFVVFDKLSNPVLAIEYDGIHHYECIYGTDYNLDLRKKYDNFKTQYCLNNNIDILRIPYFEFKNIEKILNDKLKTL